MLQPDVIVGLSDVPERRQTRGKRAMKMEDRTLRWTKQMIDSLASESADPTAQPIAEATREWPSGTAFFAPVLPISCEMQLSYLDFLEEERHKLSGLAFYDAAIVADLPTGLEDMPRLCLDEPDTPHQLIDNVALGIDLFTVPFISTSTDAGIALDISFPPNQQQSRRDHSASQTSMGVDMWMSSHAGDLSPLRRDCQCYTCLTHHKAYVQHLLNAKEMLGWVLLQLHNLHVMQRFFTGIRSSIADGTFDESRKEFGRVYHPRLPERTGQGPRYVSGIT